LFFALGATGGQYRSVIMRWIFVFALMGCQTELTDAAMGDSGWEQNARWHFGFTDANEQGEHFGRRVVSGDFDCDGLDDYVVGAPEAFADNGERSGAVFLYVGSVNGLAPAQKITQSGLSADEEWDRFGHALAVGDFDGDGCDDLAVGAPGEEPNNDPRAGAVFTFFGGNWIMTAGQVITQENTGMGRNEHGDRFGAALAVGDFSGDGWPDLAIGSPNETYAGVTSGYVSILRNDGGDFVGWQGLRSNQLAAPEDYDEFGYALAAGHMDYDGYADLAIGAPNYDGGAENAGSVFVYRGGANGVFPARQLQQSDSGGTSSYGVFGLSVAVGDVTGDHVEDLIVGAPGMYNSEGRVVAYRGGKTGPLVPKRFGQSGLGTNERGDAFGQSVAVGHLNPGAAADLVVGAPGEAPGRSPAGGAAFVYRGTYWDNFPSPWTLLQQEDGGWASEAGDEFGWSVAIGNSDGNSYPDVLIAAPNEAPGADPTSGGAFHFRGTSLGPIPSQFIDQE
jgi:hypothetical protein